MNKFLLCIGGVMMGLGICAQSVPTPIKVPDKAVLLRGGVIHTGTGVPAIQGDVLIVGGKVQAVGAIPLAGDSVEVIELAGKHVYPGLIAPCTQLGLEEVEAVRATRDAEEYGNVNPNLRTLVSYNTDSRTIPTVRSNGVLLAQAAPKGPLYAGTSSVVQLDAWSWEDAAYLADDAVHLYWPGMQVSTRRNAPPIEDQKKRQRETLESIATTLQEARAYQAAKATKRPMKTDQRWEALIPVLEKKKALWVHAETERQIRAVIAFMIEQDVRVVLVGAADAWLLTDLLKQYNIPVVLQKPHSLPAREEEDVDLPYKTARLLHEAGVLVALSCDGFWNQRNLPFMAGTAAAYGLNPEVALQLVTSNTAKVMGIDGRTGTLEPGKDATLVVSTGDLLDIRTHNVEMAWIQGRRIDLGNHQKDLYEKFKARYQED